MKNKSLLVYLSLSISVALILGFINPITDTLADFLRYEPTVVVSEPNEYYKMTEYKYMGLIEEFIPYSKQDIINIFYSILNRGHLTFTFYCPREYMDCIKDISTISADTHILTNLNNFINPFNSFRNFKAIYSEEGEVTIEIERLYNAEMIYEINQKINQIIEKNITNEMDEEEKILTIHDYIINNTKYDVERLNKKSSPYQSNTAYGPLLEGYALCSGYADAMALFLDRFAIPNFKVASETHVWNAVYINNEWLHLDLTWDDPVDASDPNNNNLIHKFYLITTETLEGYKIAEHDFDHFIYRELAK